MVTFDTAWRRIEAFAGQRFHTKTGLPFTYSVTGSSVVPDRTDYPLHVSQFRLAFQRLPLNGPGDINNLVRGPAYIYAILTDPKDRVVNGFPISPSCTGHCTLKRGASVCRAERQKLKIGIALDRDETAPGPRPNRWRSTDATYRSSVVARVEPQNRGYVARHQSHPFSWAIRTASILVRAPVLRLVKLMLVAEEMRSERHRLSDALATIDDS